MPTIGQFNQPATKTGNSMFSNGNLLDSTLIGQAVPGLSGLTQSASSIVGNALNGLPSPSNARLANAYWGAGSGLDPTSEFLRNRGFDLYKREATGRQQQGLGDLFNLLGTYSGNVVQKPGEAASNQNQATQISNQNQQFNANLGFENQQWQTQLNLLNRYLNNPAGGTGNYSPLAPNQNFR